MKINEDKIWDLIDKYYKEDQICRSDFYDFYMSAVNVDRKQIIGALEEIKLESYDVMEEKIEQLIKELEK